MQVEALIKELLATGSMNEDTTADLNRWAAEGGNPPPEARPRFDKRPPKQFGTDKKPFEKSKFGGKREREDWREHRPREKRDVVVDPDSPWAALAALRNPKPE